MSEAARTGPGDNPAAPPLRPPPTCQAEGCNQPCVSGIQLCGTHRRSSGTVGWTDLPDLPQALAVQRLTLWEAARLAPLSKECAQLYRSRRSPAQARLLRILSTGVRDGISSVQLMRILRGLNDAVRQPRRSPECRFEQSFNMQGQGVPDSLDHDSILAIITVQIRPSVTLGKDDGPVGRAEAYCVCNTGEGVCLCRWELGTPISLPPWLPLLVWLARTMSLAHILSASLGWRKPDDRMQPCGQHGDPIWLYIYAVDGINFEWVRGLLLALVQRAASLPPECKGAAGQGTGSGSLSGPQAPPVFVFCNVRWESSLGWEDPRTWEPLSDFCDLHIADHRWRNMTDWRNMTGWREPCCACGMLEGDGGKQRARPTILVLP